MVAEALNNAGYSFWTALLRRTNEFIKSARADDSLAKNDYNLGYLQALTDIEKTLPKAEIPWNVDLAKAHLWKPVQLAIVGHDKTSECTTEEYNTVYESFTLMTGSAFGVHVPFPEREK